MPGVMLPPGFRFHPTDEELVSYYLRKRVKGAPIEFDVVADVDLYKCEPWDLPSKSRLPTHDFEWFFFSPRDRKYPNGARTNRATEAGYWKATGRDRFVKTGSKTIGMKKTLVFYLGRAPHGERTHWLMHEYRLDGEEWEATNVSQEAYVLCRVFKKNGLDLPTLAGGSGEEVDNVDSPTDDKSSVLEEYNMKRGTEMPRQPVSSSVPQQAPPRTATSIQEQMMSLPPFSPAPSSDGDFNVDIMPPFPKTESYDYWMDYLLRDDTDPTPPLLQEQALDGRVEASRGGLQDSLWTGLLETPWSVKFEDCVSLPSFGQPAPVVEGLEDLDLLPHLEDQSPSPPTVQPTPSLEESFPSVEYFQQSATIQIRPRLPSAFKSPGRVAQTYSAKRRVLIKKSNTRPPAPVEEDEENKSSGPPPPVEGDEENKSSELIHEVAAGSTEVVPDETPVSADGEPGADALSAVIVHESEVENMGTRESSETISALSTSPILPSSSQLAQPPTESESSSPHPLDDDSKGKGSQEINKLVADLDQHPSMKSSISDADNQKSVTAVFHIKGYKELPPGIGSIHVNAVTITCSCNNVVSKPHVQATVCDCYDNANGANSRVLEQSLGRTEEIGLEERQGRKKTRGGLRKSFAFVFFMGVVSASVGFLFSHEFWRLSCPLVRNGVQMVTAASDL